MTTNTLHVLLQEMSFFIWIRRKNTLSRAQVVEIYSAKPDRAFDCRIILFDVYPLPCHVETTGD